ncbi:amino acid permease [Streptomyces sp. PTM05]|uniref:Amino acid permease n=1 Tax=Streptantibioticus parmotrematis TaxID=2873249 RepID=A0ABS7QTY3_9ACTN|nr:amino acid permease [Streptantibioticus parmotrematis]
MATATPTQSADTAAQRPEALSPAVDLPESLGYRLKKTFLGPPLVTSELHNEKLSKPIALGVLAPDCISSSAYGTEQMLTQLLPYVGVAGFALVMPVTGIILALLLLLTLAYRDVVMTYTKAGGSYIVARENFGPRIAQIAAVALLIDYIVTVAVQTAAGTDAVASMLQLLLHVDIDHDKLWITVGVVCLLCYGNLRGIREAGRAFSVPTYLFVLATGLTVVVGLVRLALGDLPRLTDAQLHASGTIGLGHPGGGLLMGASVFIMMRAFANGGSSLTGLEAISNGVSAFKSPQGSNARRTLVVMSCILGVLVLGVSTLAWQTHAMPYTSGSPTVLAQEAHLVFGQSGFGNVMFAFVQIATALILYTGGNTSFNGFPFLASFVAEDSFLPRQLTIRGHRLAFSNGIIVLTVVSLALLIATGGNLTKLVSLYAIGVFTGFVMAASGLFRYHWNRRERHRTARLVINGAAAIASAAVVLIFAITKFTEGAWLVVVIFPIGVVALIRTNSRYRTESEVLRAAPAASSVPTWTRSVVYVLVDRLDLAVIKALRYAHALRPTELRAVYFMVDDHNAERLRAEWEASRAADVSLEIIECPDRRVRRAAAELAARTVAEGDTEVTLLIPRRTYGPIIGRLLHSRFGDSIAQAVSRLPHVAATIVPFDVATAIEEAEEVAGVRRGPDEPGESAVRAEGNRHPAVRRAASALLTHAEPPAEPPAGRADGTTAIGELAWRHRAVVRGRVRSVQVTPVSGSPRLECELYDESGGVVLVFYGRRSVPGIEAGTELRADGMVGATDGYLSMANPTYALLPAGAEEAAGAVD